MPKYYISNAFSIRMIEPLLKNEKNVSIEMERFSDEGAREWVRKHKNEVISAVGHESTARLAGDVLGIEVPMNRVAIELDHGDELLVLTVNIPRNRLSQGEIPLEELRGYEGQWVLVKVR